MARRLLTILCIVTCTNALAKGTVENPPAGVTVSGIGLISGWACGASKVSAAIDGGTPIAVPAGSARADTAGECVRGDNGFGLLFNFNTLTPGSHTLSVSADGEALPPVRFEVVTLGAEFIGGVAANTWLVNFPATGKRTRLDWQTSTQNFAITAQDGDVPGLGGAYTGAITVGQSDCVFVASLPVSMAAQMNGGTLQWNMTLGAGESCRFTGTPQAVPATGAYVFADGQFSCSDGKTGVWSTPGLFVTGAGMVGGFNYQYSDGCYVYGNLGAARAP
jgi:hypothetical protein